MKVRTKNTGRAIQKRFSGDGIGSTKLLTWEGTKVGDEFKRDDGFITQAGEKLEGLTRTMENRPEYGGDASLNGKQLDFTWSAGRSAGFSISSDDRRRFFLVKMSEVHNQSAGVARLGSTSG